MGIVDHESPSSTMSRTFLVIACVLCALGTADAMAHLGNNGMNGNSSMPCNATNMSSCNMTVESWAAPILADSDCASCLALDQLNLANDNVAELNGNCALFKAVGACFKANKCCEFWDDMVDAFVAKSTCSKAALGQCEVDVSNQVVLETVIDATACPDAEDLAGFDSALGTVLGIDDSLISSDCAATRRRLLAVTITSDINAVDADMAKAIQKAIAEDGFLAAFNAELASEGLSFKATSVKDVTPSLDAAASLLPSVVVGLLGLVAGRFVVKA